MKRILFAVSDLHGCYTELKEALDNAGFQEGNPNHILIAVGDMFDRGSEQKEMYEFLVKLDNSKQLKYILGNHDLMLIDLFKGDTHLAEFNCRRNGLIKTLEQIFFKRKWSYGRYLSMIRATKEFQDMAKWLMSKPLFLETEDYVFAHAGIPFDDNWRNTMSTDDLWIQTWQMLDDRVPHLVDGKILVCGHWHTIRLRIQFDGLRDNLDEFDYIPNHKMYAAKHGHMIGIDGCTNHSKLVNVLVVQQEM